MINLDASTLCIIACEERCDASTLLATRCRNLARGSGRVPYFAVARQCATNGLYQQPVLALYYSSYYYGYVMNTVAKNTCFLCPRGRIRNSTAVQRMRDFRSLQFLR